MLRGSDDELQELKADRSKVLANYQELIRDNLHQTYSHSVGVACPSHRKETTEDGESETGLYWKILDKNRFLLKKQSSGNESVLNSGFL
ncbi:hypothetical protein [Nostoc sp.]|uniref:hypothetical protein n=1 Tax=Nostoc sp. TaxID=1180 RepID=UPI002FF62265